MDKLRSISGGQPLRVQDWELIQNSVKTVLKALTNGMQSEPRDCIITGMEVTIENGTISLTEGFYYDGQEIFYVPAASFAYQGNIIDGAGSSYFSLYIMEKITSSELRTFKDSSSHNVWEYRQYEVGYSDDVPSTGVLYSDIPRLLNLQKDYFISQIPVTAETVQFVKKVISSNDLDQYQVLIAAPGAGKVIQVISLSAMVTPTSVLNAGSQNINVFYGTDVTEVGIGYFSNQFIESGIKTSYQMTPVPGQLYENQSVGVGLSGETRPETGLAQFTFYIVYKIITL